MADWSWLEQEENVAPTEKRGDVGWLQRHAVISGKMNINEAKLLKSQAAWKKWNKNNPNHVVYAPPDYWCRDDPDSKEKQSLVLKLVETGQSIEAVETQNVLHIKKQLQEKGVIPKEQRTPEQKAARKQVEGPPEGFMDDLSEAANSFQPEESSDNMPIQETDDESEAGPSTLSTPAKANGKAKKIKTPVQIISPKKLNQDCGIYQEKEKLNLPAEEVLDLLFDLDTTLKSESDSGIFRGEKQIPISAEKLLNFLIRKQNDASN